MRQAAPYPFRPRRSVLSPQPETPPPGYVALSENGIRAWVLEVEQEAVAAALFHARGCAPLEAAGGRGGVLRFDLGQGEGVLRPFRRGGIAGRVLANRYFRDNRPLREFRVHAELLRRGAPCAPLLGVAWQAQGPWFSGAIATGFIEGPSLESLLAGDAAEEALQEALSEAGRAVRALHDAGGLHADLHPGNILVAREGAFLIDFDRARLFPALSPAQRASNLLRLRRAFVKRGHDPRHLATMLEAYGGGHASTALQRVVAMGRERWVRRKTR